MARAELGNLTVSYCPPSAANVNCENPRRKPVSHPQGPNWGCRGGFSHRKDAFSYALHSPRHWFTGCTQEGSLSGLRRSGPWVQSRRRRILVEVNVVPGDQGSGGKCSSCKDSGASGGLPAL